MQSTERHSCQPASLFVPVGQGLHTPACAHGRDARVTDHTHPQRARTRVEGRRAAVVARGAGGGQSEGGEEEEAEEAEEGGGAE